MSPLKFSTWETLFHSIMPLHHVGSERNCNAGITTSRGHCNKAAPPASNSPFLIQPHARSPSVVRTLFWDTRLLQLGIIIASACRHSSIQSIPPVEGTFMVKDESLTRWRGGNISGCHIATACLLGRERN